MANYNLEQVVPMPKMTFKLKADNSSGRQDLIVDPYHPDTPGQVAITLVGQYEGEEIQIDFDPVDRATFKANLKTLIEQLEDE